jgi:hypothetical protein
MFSEISLQFLKFCNVWKKKIGGEAHSCLQSLLLSYVTFLPHIVIARALTVSNCLISIDRYTASMGEPPRGTYYPASPGTGNQPPRHYQFNATNPWEREEREKVLKSQFLLLC